jgi:restriction system protein
LSHHFKLTNEEKKLYPTKKVSLFYEGTHWALNYLKHGGLLIGIRRGFFKITENGKHVLATNPAKIDDTFLKQSPEFIEVQKVKRKEGKKIERK